VRHPSFAHEFERRPLFEAAKSAAEVRALEEQWRREDEAEIAAQGSQAKQAADHERRLAYLEDIAERQLGMLLDLVIKTLRKEIAEVEAKQLRFGGVFEPGQSYSPGSLVIKAGGLWHCNSPTTDTPGKSNAWTLAVKSGEASKMPGIA
jgi:hypothetical protein